MNQNKTRSSAANPVCTHCNRTAEKVSKTEPSKQVNQRFVCPVPSCSSTFSRPSDLARHQKSIHGPKKECPHTGCGYMTGRADKMKEHIGKIHRIVGSDTITGEEWSLEAPFSRVSFELLSGQDVMEYNTVEMNGGWRMTGTYVDVGFDDCWATPWDYVNVHGSPEWSAPPV